MLKLYCWLWKNINLFETGPLTEALNLACHDIQGS
jgi:hypothetical protein